MSASATIVTDIGYGDAGKGTMVDYLVRQAPSAAVIRHNGGPQAAHNVITPDGRHHTFAQFGSGSFVNDTWTHLSKYMLVNPLNMFPEAEHLQKLGVQNVWDRLSVDRDALVITPWQCSANRLRELARGDNRHGSCGQGVGETMSDSLAHPTMVLRVRDLLATGLETKLEALRHYKMEQLREELGEPRNAAMQEEWQALSDPHLSGTLVEAYRSWTSLALVVDETFLEQLSQKYEALIFEGAQGVLLDEWYGFHPYTTWSTTTNENALRLLSDADFTGEITRLGVLRSYATRHGAGPFVTEDKALAPLLTEQHNGRDPWQGTFRYGHLDLVAHRYALAACGTVDALAITGCDRMEALPSWMLCDAYRFADSVPDKHAFFSTTTGGTVTSIRLGVKGDLDRQARLSTLLQSCVPVYQTMSASGGYSFHNYLQTVEEGLGLPITITSYGPTAADKRAYAAC